MIALFVCLGRCSNYYQPFNHLLYRKCFFLHRPGTLYIVCCICPMAIGFYDIAGSYQRLMFWFSRLEVSLKYQPLFWAAYFLVKKESWNYLVIPVCFSDSNFLLWVLKSNDQRIKIEFSSVKSIHFKTMYYLQHIASSNMSMWKRNRFWEESKTILPSGKIVLLSSQNLLCFHIDMLLVAIRWR